MHQIGVGVLGPVFRTYEPSEDRLVAVKAFHLDITPEQARTLIEALERLIAAELAHPGLVAPLAVGLEDDVPYLAQEYVAAESLDVAIRHYSPASIGTVMPFIRQMATAVDAAHEQGVVHGALHLRDIFVTPDEARMTGFGIVRALEEIGLAGPIRRPYTAPEVIAGRGWDAAADRFALAAVAYELLTGRRAAGTGDQVTERIRSIDDVSDPEHLEEVFATALADDPEDRYSSANRFVSALEFGVDEAPGDRIGVEPEVDRHVDTAPLDLLAGLELHRQDQAVDQTLDPVEQVESTVRNEPDDEVIRPPDQDIAPGISTIDFDESESDDQAENQKVWSVGDPVEFSLDATQTEDAEEGGEAEPAFQVGEFSDDDDGSDRDDSGVVPVADADAEGEGYADIAAANRADLEVIDHPVVSDQRYVADDSQVEEEDENDDDGHDQDYRDVIPVLPPQTEEAYNPRSFWSRGVVPVLAIALVVGSIAYFLGVAFAPDDGPTDRVLETQGAALDPADVTDRELSEELVGAGATASAVDAAGGAPARRLNPAAETLSDASSPIESGDSAPGTRPAPEPEPVSLPPAGSPEVAQPGTRTVRAPAAGAGAPPVLPEATSATGWLLVRTDPPGATVTLDGVGRGQTPLSLGDVSFGTHRLEVSRAGFGSVQREVTLNEEETVVPVGVSLTPAGRSAVAGGDAAQTGSLAVRSRPPGAQVMVDETVAGVTPLVVALPVGRHQVRIQGDGYRPWVTSVEVLGSERAQVSASLERPR